MGFSAWGNDSEQYKAHQQAYDPKHKAHLSHELIAAAASYEAAKMYQDHEKKNGKPASHQKAKELFAGFAGFAVTHIAETKVADKLSEHQLKKAQKDACDHGEAHIAKHY